MEKRRRKVGEENVGVVICVLKKLCDSGGRG